MAIYYSELTAKELINYHDGKKLGWAGVYDLVIDANTGQLQSLVVEKRAFFGGHGGDEIMIPWAAIKRIGTDVIILDFPLGD
mgnify:CR=1 FL=1